MYNLFQGRDENGFNTYLILGEDKYYYLNCEAHIEHYKQPIKLLVNEEDMEMAEEAKKLGIEIDEVKPIFLNSISLEEFYLEIEKLRKIWNEAKIEPVIVNRVKTYRILINEKINVRLACDYGEVDFAVNMEDEYYNTASLIFNTGYYSAFYPVDTPDDYIDTLNFSNINSFNYGFDDVKKELITNMAKSKIKLFKRKDDLRYKNSKIASIKAYFEKAKDKEIKTEYITPKLRHDIIHNNFNRDCHVYRNYHSQFYKLHDQNKK